MKKFCLLSFIFSSVVSAAVNFSSTNLIAESSYEMLPYEISLPANQADFFGFFEQYLSIGSDAIKTAFINSQFACDLSFFNPYNDPYKTKVSRDPALAAPYQVTKTTNPYMSQGYNETATKNMYQDFSIYNFIYEAKLTDMNYDIFSAITSNPALPSLAKKELATIKALFNSHLNTETGTKSMYDYISSLQSGTSLDALRGIFSPSYIMISKMENNNLESLVQNANFLIRLDDGRIALKIQTSDVDFVHENGIVAYSQNQNAWVVINAWNNPSKNEGAEGKYGLSISKLQVYSNGYRAATSCDFTKEGKLLNYDFKLEK